MKKQKHGFWVFIFSLIPGAGEMYMGFKKQAIKKYKLQPVSVSVAKVKAKELNVEEVLYMNVQKNKYAYIVKDGARGIMLYSDERSLYTKLYKGLKMTPLQP